MVWTSFSKQTFSKAENFNENSQRGKTTMLARVVMYPKKRATE